MCLMEKCTCPIWVLEGAANQHMLLHIHTCKTSSVCKQQSGGSAKYNVLKM